MAKIYVAGGDGLYGLDLSRNGRLTLFQHEPMIDKPSYLVKKDGWLYVARKNTGNQDDRGGIANYSIDPNGNLACHDSYHSSGHSYTHLCVSVDDRYLFAANYELGATAAYELKDHRVIKKVSVAHHQGHGPVAIRQDGPHVHQVGFTSDRRFLYSVDLGSDEIVLYHYDRAVLEEFRKQKIVPGSGPRHMIFGRDGRFSYLVNELANTIMVMHYHDSMFTMIQMIATIPRHYQGENSAAAIHLSHDGRYLFVSNRGHDSIAMYALNPENGKLFLLNMVHTKKSPRDFCIVDDQWLVAACQGSDCLEVLKLDLAAEKLTPGIFELDVPSPVCVV